MNKLMSILARIDWCIFAPVIGALICLSGCSSNPRYIEGTTLNLGAYVPFESSIYGIELVSYVNGVKVQTSSNQPFWVSRSYCSTNEWLWGMVKTIENSETEIDVK